MSFSISNFEHWLFTLFFLFFRFKMNFESNTFRAFLKEIQIENETYKYFDVARLNEEKYSKQFKIYFMFRLYLIQVDWV